MRTLKTRSWPATLGHFCCLLFAAAPTANAQFQVIGPAPIPPTVARQQIRTLLEKVAPDNRQQTIKTLSDLTPWYRDILDEELIAAWRKDDRTNLALVIEPLADPRVAAGIIEFSWRQQRQAAFTPASAPMLGRLMERYPDSAKPFLDDLLASTAPGRPALDLSPPEVEAVCRILLDMPDLRTWKRIALQILHHYPEAAKNLLDKDLQSDDGDRRDRAYRWLADFAALDAALAAQHGAGNPAGNRSAPAGPPSGAPAGGGLTKPTLLTKVEPQYSEIARKLRVQDTVTLQVAISPDGTPGAVKVVRPVGYGLDEKAVEAAQQWTFSPGMRDGKGVTVLLTIQVNFRLGNLDAATTWASGPMAFAPAPGVTPPVVEDGTMPKTDKEASDESVVLEFTVNSSGSVENIHATEGSDSAAELLTGNLASWRFRPAMNGAEAVAATGRIRFIKGKGDDSAKLPLTPPLPQDATSAPDHALEKSAGASGGGIYSVGEDVSDPTLLHRVDAGYSDAALAAGVKGVVTLRIVIDAAGNVVNPTVITGLGLGLDEKAIEAVKQWKFTPAYKDGKPVAVAKTVEISFALQ
jgi:TonB family protein